MVDRSLFFEPQVVEMELRAHTPGGSTIVRRVRDHLAIGNSAACDLIIDDDDAACIHAIVYPSYDNGWELRGAGLATLLSEEGQVVSSLRLADGVTFMIAQTRFTCWEIPFAQAVQDSRPVEEVPPPPDAEQAEAERQAQAELMHHAAVAMGRCPSCWKSVAGLAPIARFCPKCGGALPAMGEVAPVDAAALEPMYQELREELDAKLAEAPSAEASRLMVLAYASALLNLGWRYEHGAGASRNIPEAARCYAKAERLARAGGAV